MLEKSPLDLTIVDIKAFCDQKIPESRWLDYKESYKGPAENKTVAKIISAMANAHGGWVLYGIKEGGNDSQGRGLPGEIIGLDKTLNPAERIKQICMDAIYPPLLPLIGTVQLDGTDRVLVVVRVFESESAPHQTSEGKVYVRMNDVSSLRTDGTEATVSNIEGLLNKRQRAKELKTRLISQSDARRRLNPKVPQLILTCVPAYPDTPIASYESLLEIAGTLKTMRLFNEAKVFSTAHESLLSQFVRHFPNESDGKPSRLELNLYGLISFGTVIVADHKTGSHCAIFPKTIAALLYSFLLGAYAFYSEHEFAGLIEVAASLRCEGDAAKLWQPEGTASGISEMPDKTFSVRTTLLSDRLIEDDVFVCLMNELLWGAGRGPETIERQLATNYLEELRESESAQFRK